MRDKAGFSGKIFLPQKLGKWTQKGPKTGFFEFVGNTYYNYLPPKDTYSLLTISKTFKKTPSILNIKKRKLDSVFSFRKTTQEEVSKVIRNLNTKKSCQKSDTPTKIIKLNPDIFSNLIYKHFTYCVDKGGFLNDLKHAELFQYIRKINAKKKTIDL